MIVFDIDGTLSLPGDRLKHIQGDNKDWKSFFADVKKDEINAPIAKIYRTMVYYYGDRGIFDTVVVVTGRPEYIRKATLEWFAENSLPLVPDNLYMRHTGDFRPDHIVKPELVTNHLHEISLVFEDRTSMVREWRSRGITCVQVTDGDY